MKFPGVQCFCGDTEIFSIKPGLEGARRGAVDLFTRANPLVERPVPDVVLCFGCWAVVFGRVVGG